MKAALYAQFSTDKQSGESVEDQLRKCERLADRHGVCFGRLGYARLARSRKDGHMEPFKWLI